jgi:Golgi nucleoside diphosphatase
MEKDLIEISRYYGENREAVIYQNMVDGVKTYELHLFEDDKKIIPQSTQGFSIHEIEDKAEDFVTHNNG